MGVLAWYMQQAPVLLEAMRSELVPLGAARTDGEKVSTSRDGAPVPIRLDPLDDADDLWAILQQTAEHAFSLIGGSAPRGLAVGRRDAAGDVVGLPANLTPGDARSLAFGVCSWLGSVEPSLDRHPELADSLELLRERIWDLGARWRTTWVDVPAVTCSLCGHPKIWAPDPTGKTLSALCRKCGDVLMAAQRHTTVQTRLQAGVE